MLYGAVVGVVSVAGMLTIVGFADNVAILPENTREWREVFEYAASIMLAYVTGNVLAALAQRMVPKTLDASSAPSPAVLHARAYRRRARWRARRCAAGRRKSPTISGQWEPRLARSAPQGLRFSRVFERCLGDGS